MMSTNPSRAKVSMQARPKDLPDFATPPLIEVVLGIQFERIKQLRSVHLGPLWEVFRKDFPNVQEQSPLNPSFETFGTKRGSNQLNLEVLTGPLPLPRLWFVDEAQNRLLQFQPDRFIHNWRKVQEGDSYPRFEQIREDFAKKVSELAAFLKIEGLGHISPNQCEVTYVNHILPVEGEHLFAHPEKVLGVLHSCADMTPTNELEESRIQLKFVLKSSGGAPVGRLVVDAQPVFSNEGTQILRLTLSARGQPDAPNVESALAFLDSGREKIVRAFAELTTEEMHQRWGRKA